MRGKGSINHCVASLYGITPAHAGKSTRYSSHNQRDWDHPRACGEKNDMRRCAMELSGSPPRMRGKESMLKTFARLHGITPAHAGKSSSFALQEFGRWDHPRACGEKTKKIP